MISRFPKENAGFRLTLYVKRANLAELPPGWVKECPTEFSLVNRMVAMKISQVCAVALLLIVGSALAFAGPINDPKVIVKGAGGGGELIKGPCPQCMGVGQNFSFKTPASGTGVLYFTNESGINWNSLTLIEKGVPAADISCNSPLFSSCTTETLKNGSVEILLTNAGKANWHDKGIPNGANFAIDFSCKGGCWPGGLTFNGHGSASAHATPEPGTIALMVTGLGALVSRRKVWKNRWNS